MILVSLIYYYVKIFFSATQEMVKAIRIFITGTCIYMEHRLQFVFIFVRYFSVMQFLNVKIFRWKFFFNSVLFSGAALLNRFTKSSEFEGFNGMSCYDHFLDHSPMWCYYQCYYKKPGNFCFLIRSWQERFCHNIIFNTRIYHSFEDTCNLIKIVTFNVNPKFTGVALNRFIFTMDIFCTNPARKFGLIDFT